MRSARFGGDLPKLGLLETISQYPGSAIPAAISAAWNVVKPRYEEAILRMAVGLPSFGENGDGSYSSTVRRRGSQCTIFAVFEVKMKILD